MKIEARSVGVRLKIFYCAVDTTADTFSHFADADDGFGNMTGGKLASGKVRLQIFCGDYRSIGG